MIILSGKQISIRGELVFDIVTDVEVTLLDLGFPAWQRILRSCQNSGPVHRILGILGKLDFLIEADHGSADERHNGQPDHTCHDRKHDIYFPKFISHLSPSSLLADLVQCHTVRGNKMSQIVFCFFAV